MNNPQKVKFLMIIFALILTISFISVTQTQAFDTTTAWPSQAKGCTAVPGNINAHMADMYLGSGSTVPQNILNYDSKANASLLPAWKTNMIGMNINVLKSFIIPSSQGFTSGNLSGKDLYIEAKILIVVYGPTPTSSDSVIDFLYSMYTGCQVTFTKPGQTASSSTTTTTTTGIVGSNNPISPNSVEVIFFGGLAGLVILAGIGYFIYNRTKSGSATDKILNASKKKETESIKSLKESLGTENSSKPNTPIKKAPPSRRRR